MWYPGCDRQMTREQEDGAWASEGSLNAQATQRRRERRGGRALGLFAASKSRFRSQPRAHRGEEGPDCEPLSLCSLVHEHRALAPPTPGSRARQ